MIYLRDSQQATRKTYSLSQFHSLYFTWTNHMVCQFSLHFFLNQMFCNSLRGYINWGGLKITLQRGTWVQRLLFSLKIQPV